jgi:hypothetical protein
MKRPRLIIVGIFLLIVVLSVVQAVVANKISTAGIQLGDMQEKILTLKKENQIIHERILTLSSLNHVASEASRMGFVPDTSHVYLSTPLPLALK